MAIKLKLKLTDEDAKEFLKKGELPKKAKKFNYAKKGK